MEPKYYLDVRTYRYTTTRTGYISNAPPTVRPHVNHEAPTTITGVINKHQLSPPLSSTRTDTLQMRERQLFVGSGITPPIVHMWQQAMPTTPLLSLQV